MDLTFFVFYAEANVICILVLGFLLINDRLYSTKQEKQLWFNRTVIMHILYFASDICWAAVLGGQLPRTRLLVGLFNFSNYVLLNLLAFEWFMYMAVSEKMSFMNSIRYRSMCRVPMLLAVAVMIAAYVAAPEFWISPEGELNALYYPLMVSGPIVYLLAAFIISLVNARKTGSRSEKRQYLLIGIYPLGVLAFGLIQTFFMNAPLFCFGCMIMMLFFYIQNIQTQVSLDSLTRLNNRRQINRYMEQTQYKANTVTTAMMLDIDRFKQINDTYGHAEGDRALVLVSETLKQIAESAKLPVFLGRYGGDEFTVFIRYTQESEAEAETSLPERIATALEAALSEKQVRNKLPYDLDISYGYDTLKDKNDTLEACLNRADEKLYENKKKKGTLRGSLR